MLHFDTNADLAAASGGAVPTTETVAQIAGYGAAGDGGGALYRRASSEPPHGGKIQDGDDGWWELAEPEVNCLMFGCDPTDSSDSSAAMKAFFDYCIDQTRTMRAETQVTTAGFIPAGTYRIAWGTLVFDTAPDVEPCPLTPEEDCYDFNRTTPERLAWPDIRTAGFYLTIFKGTGSTASPMITFRNGEPEVAIDRTWMGGSLGGIRIVPGSGVTHSMHHHGLSLNGVAFCRFGDIYCEDIGGSAVFIPQQVVDGYNPDPHHVSSCQFATIAAIRAGTDEEALVGGRALENLNNVGLTGNTIQTVRAISTMRGGIFGLGAGNTIEVLDMGSCKGWAVDDGYDGLPIIASRNRINAAELDDVEYGFKIGCSQDSVFEKLRFIHRFNGPNNDTRSDDLFWPKQALRIGYSSDREIINTRIEVRHRVDPFNFDAEDSGEVATAQAGLGQFCVLGYELSNAFYADNLSGVRVRQTLQNNTVLEIDDDDLLVGEQVPSLTEIRRDETKLFDGIHPRMASATYSGSGVTIPAGGFTTDSAVLDLDNVRFDPHGDFDQAGPAFVVPYDGYAAVKLSLTVPDSSTTRLRLGILRDDGSSLTTPACRYYPVESSAGYIQSFELNQVIPVAKGDLLYPMADQNSGSPLTATGIVTSNDIQFSVRMI